jgi:hypothetical protein
MPSMINVLCSSIVRRIIDRQRRHRSSKSVRSGGNVLRQRPTVLSLLVPD